MEMNPAHREESVSVERTEPTVTVFIPTWFAGEQLRVTLDAVMRQKTSFPYEVLLYDTSSTDVTPSIIEEFAERYPNVRHKTIAKADFSHGRTREEAARDAKGEVVAFLTQDAVPTSDNWLTYLVEPILRGDADAVLGQQIPQPYAPPILKYDIIDTFASLGPADRVTLYSEATTPDSQREKDVAAFFSDVNSAVRREILVTTVPFRDVPYAEDHLLGRDVLAAGLTKAYSPLGAVFHTNEMSFTEFKKRIFDETVGLRKVGIAMDAPSYRTIMSRVVQAVRSQTPRILHDAQYSLQRRLFWVVTNPWLQWEKWVGARQGALVDIEDEVAVSSHSLEAERGRKYGQATG